MKRLDKIRERLKAATPWPWSIDMVDYTYIRSDAINDVIACAGTVCDRIFIASAPADISYLLETVEKLREALEFYEPLEMYSSAGTAWPKITFDYGERARAALKEIESSPDGKEGG